jgi:hypothetical protein
MKTYVWPYKPGSKSAKDLAAAIPCLRKKTNKLRGKGTIINWGNSVAAQWDWGKRAQYVFLNGPLYVAGAANKLTTFKKLSAAKVACVDWTESIEVAKQWIADRKSVYCRTLLNSHGGRGIVRAKEVGELVYAPLYTKGMKKEREFRIHVMKGQVIFQQEKKMMSKERRPANFNPYVRNHENGWVFADQGVAAPGDVLANAIAAVAALGLDFGAVDVGWNANEGSKVFEVNTAMGLQPKLATLYASKLKELYAL